jgi:p-hydroxybenzoate 3-monooxygenase
MNSSNIFFIKPVKIFSCYLECPANDTEDAWPSERIWNELRRCLGESFLEHPIIERNILNMRSVITESMQYGRLFLAGDAAHIITPVGAKGMNLANGDAQVLAHALIYFYQEGNSELLETYSERRLPHIWRKHAFSDWMLHLIHSSLEPSSPFSHRLRQTHIQQLSTDNEFSRWFATQYVGIE